MVDILNNIIQNDYEEQFYRDFKKYYRKIKLYVSKRIFDKEQANDIAHDIIFKLLKQLKEKKELPDNLSLAKYVYNFTKYEVKTILNKMKKLGKYHFEEYNDEIYYNKQINEIDKFEEEIIKKQCKNAINSLKSKEHKIVLYLYFYEEKTVQEIAKELGKTPQQISNLKSYALNILKKKFKNFQDFQ